MAKKKALGRGLSALIGEIEQAYENNLNDNSDLVIEIDIDLIKPNPLQPRKTFNESSLIELANSIKEHGILQPILIYKNDNEYFLIAGERRLKASKIAKLPTIRAILVDIQLEKLRELALIENIQREDLNPLDLALSYEALIKDYGITQDELAVKLQKSRTQITNTLSLLRLPDEAQKLLVDGKISQGHAKVLVNLKSEDFTLALNSIIGQKLSVRETENLVKKIKTSTTNHDKTQIIEFKDDIQKLSDLFKSIDIDTKISNNSLVIKFKNKEKIHRLTKILSNLKDL